MNPQEQGSQPLKTSRIRPVHRKKALIKILAIFRDVHRRMGAFVSHRCGSV